MFVSIAAGTLTSKAIKAGVLVAAVDVSKFVAQVVTDPPNGIGDIVSTAAQEGLAFSLAVLFVGLLITRKIKVVDPEETKANEAIKNKVEGLETSVSHMQTEATKSATELGHIKTELGNVTTALAKVVNGLDDVKDEVTSR